MPEQKKEITVTLEVKELVFDIKNKTYLTGRSREAEGTKNYEAASNMQASDDEENDYQMRRSITNAFSDLKTELAEYLKEEGTTTTNKVKAEVDADGQLKLVLGMPSNYNVASADNLGAGLHQYIVNKSIADWFTITNKADANDYVGLSKESLETVKRALYKRERPVRPTFQAQQS